MRTTEQIIQAEVHYCVSYLVSTLAGGYGLQSDRQRGSDPWRAMCDLNSLCEQACELAAPIPDYEEAARQAGWVERPAEPNSDWCVVRGTTSDDSEYAHGFKYAETWQEACEVDDIEPYDREVFEHWIVSDWLADKLEAKGEKVDRDFAGMIVWARTTTGQAISMDSVIEAIRADLVREYGEA